MGLSSLANLALRLSARFRTGDRAPLRAQETSPSIGTPLPKVGGDTASPSLATRVTQRRFTNLAAAAVGAAAGALALEPKRAEALDEWNTVVGNSLRVGPLEPRQSYAGATVATGGSAGFGFTRRNMTSYPQYDSWVQAGDIWWWKSETGVAELVTFYPGISAIAASPSGNVGIGTTSPTAKLEVMGAIKVNGTQAVDTSGVAMKAYYAP